MITKNIWGRLKNIYQPKNYAKINQGEDKHSKIDGIKKLLSEILILEKGLIIYQPWCFLTINRWKNKLVFIILKFAVYGSIIKYYNKVSDKFSKKWISEKKYLHKEKYLIKKNNCQTF